LPRGRGRAGPLDDEIRSHLEHEIDDNVARGMTREEAEAAACGRGHERI
jgi:hypothetical protein